MASVLNNIVNNNIGGTTPADRNKWYYMVLFIAIAVLFFMYVKIDISLDGKKSKQDTKTTEPKVTKVSSDGRFYHTKITKMTASLEDQRDEMEQQFYS